MKSNVFIYKNIILFILILLIKGCEFPDLRTVPAISSSEAKYITPISATIDCVITDGGGAVVTDRGVCYCTLPIPTIKDTKVPFEKWAPSFSVYLTGLDINTKYYARAYATNEKGTSYGDVISFTTKSWVYGTVTDYDGNIYNTFKISDFDQVWIQENLKVTHYSNGEIIPNVTDDSEWENLSTGAYCYFNNNPDYKTTYGLLYNAYIVEENRNVCPTGWHIPTNSEWQAFSYYLGCDDVSGGKMKEAGRTYWIGPNTGADNSSGFTGIAGSFRHEDGIFSTSLGYYGSWWSSTKSSKPDWANSFVLFYRQTAVR